MLQGSVGVLLEFRDGTSYRLHIFFRGGQSVWLHSSGRVSTSGTSILKTKRQGFEIPKSQRNTWV